MYNEPPRGGRPDFRGRGMPPEKMGDREDQKEFKPRGEFKPDQPRGPPRDGEMRGGRGGRFERELKPFNPRDDQKGPDGGLDRAKFGDAIRGNRGMRGSRGSGRGGRGGERGGSDMETGRGRGRQPGEPFKPSQPRGGERGDGEGAKVRVHQKPSRGGRGEGAGEDN